jgi:hypothetical protein
MSTRQDFSGSGKRWFHYALFRALQAYIDFER